MQAPRWNASYPTQTEEKMSHHHPIEAKSRQCECDKKCRKEVISPRLAPDQRTEVINK